MGDMSLSRRRLLAGASATAALGVLGNGSVAQAKAPMLNAPAPAFYRFKLGSIEATVVSDGPLSIGDPKNTFRGPTAEEIGKMMSDHFLPTNNVVLDQNVLVINTGDKLALFETGMSSVKRTDAMGQLAANLKKAGIDPNDIDAVIPTHAHIDHIGGIMAADGSRNFPNAQIYISQADFEFWTDDKRLGTPAEGSALAAKEPAAEPGPHRVLQGRPGGPPRRAGDAHSGTHCRAYQLRGQFRRQVAVPRRRPHASRYPDREAADGSRVRHRSQAGGETRIKVMDMLASQRMATLVYHLPWPGIGHLAKRGDGFHYVPEPMQLAL